MKLNTPSFTAVYTTFGREDVTLATSPGVMVNIREKATECSGSEDSLD